MKEGSIFTKDGKEYCVLEGNFAAEIKEYNAGVPVLDTEVTTKEEGFDEFGNPKRSVCVKVKGYRMGIKEGNIGG